MSPKTLIQKTDFTNTTLQSQKAVEDSQESKKSKTRIDQAEIPPQDKAEWPEKEKEKRGSAPPPPLPRKSDMEEGGTSGRERLKRHRVEVAGRVWIPDMWGQEELLKDWADCASFDASLVRSTIMLARDSLAKEARTTTTPLSPHLTSLHHSC